MAKPDPVQEYGFTAVPRSVSALFLDGKPNHVSPTPVSITDIPIPSSTLATAVHDYARKALPKETYHHSMRVFFYGTAIAREQFPSWKHSDETYFLACLLHDIGTTPENISVTLMSFEFYGGMLALDLISNKLGGPREQGESVCEAIIRHQDIGESGKITTVGQLIQLATIFDNMGEHADLVHQKTIEEVTGTYPRMSWSSCFAATIRRENGLKPWAHTTALGEDDFPNGVLGNKLMAPYDEMM